MNPTHSPVKRQQRLHCALVCDKPGLSVILSHCIEQAGFVIDWRCPSVDKALNLLNQKGHAIDVLILDIQLSKSHVVSDIHHMLQQQTMTILLCATSHTPYHEQLFAALANGAMHVLILDEQADVAMQEKVVHILRNSKQSRTNLHPATSQTQPQQKLVVIGASTGGPSAAVNLLQALPYAPDISVLLVQHLDATFCASMSSWMDAQLDWPVRTAQHQQTLQPGEVLLAAGNQHWLLDRFHRLNQSSEDHGFFIPSIDALMFSVVQNWHGKATAVLLTGMGKDGALGLASFQHQGRHTFAQDQATSMMFSMPQAAIALHAAEFVLPPTDIGAEIHRIFNHQPINKGAFV